MYSKTKTIILDCPVYGGNSGGPVIQLFRSNNGVDEYKIIGVVSHYIPYVQEWVNSRDKLIHKEYLNSGYSVITSFDPVLELIQEIEDTI